MRQPPDAMEPNVELIRPEYIRLGPQGPEVSDRVADVLRAFGTIESVEHGPAPRRREYQQQRLAEILGHARACSPFWAARIPAGRHALWRLPLLHRRDLRAQVQAEGALPLPPEHGELIPNATSGSSGEALTFWCSSLAGAYNEARYSFDDVMSGRDLTLPFTAVSKRFKSVESFERWPSLTGEFWRTGGGRGIPISTRSIEEGIEDILAGPVGHLLTRPAALDALIGHVQRTGRQPERLGEILANSETVTPALRARTREVLGARIADRYSCEELGPIAFQCPTLDTHYHVATSNVLLEAVDDRGRPAPDGRPGNLVVTGLNALATPILRYDIGDVGRLLPRCPCGHAGPALTDLQGRRKGLLRLPDGRRLYCNLSAKALLAAAPVREFRILQTGARTLVIRVVADGALTPAQTEGIAELLRAETSPDFAVQVESVDAIDWGEGGKRITVLNLLDHPLDRLDA
jgi:phenylacetate-CoA ligase